jgi:hypothetical protein
VPGGLDNPSDFILVADGSPLSTVAVEQSMDFARDDADAKVTVLTVVTVGIPRHLKVYPATGQISFTPTGRGRPRKRYIPDILSRQAEDMLANAKWQNGNETSAPHNKPRRLIKSPKKVRRTHDFETDPERFLLAAGRLLHRRPESYSASQPGGMAPCSHRPARDIIPPLGERGR